MNHLDLKDRRILFELSKNCRLPTTQIAKKVGLSQQVVDYRINKLIKKKIISDFVTGMNIKQLEYNRYIMFLQLKQVNEQKEKEIIDYLTKNPFLTWVVTSTGKWNIIADIIANNDGHASQIVHKIKERYEGFVGGCIITTQLEYSHMHSKYYGIKQENVGIKTQKIKSRFTIDNIDVKILNALSTNARTDFVNLSKSIGINPNSVRNRTGNMIKSGIITSFHIEPNKHLLGLEQYYLQFTFENFNTEREKQLLDYMVMHPNVNAYYKPLGYSDFEAGIFVKDPGELRRIVLDIRNKFSDIIKINDTILFYEEYKSNHIPSGVFQNLLK
jgi:Lrp/AsnC family transcriptional regulator, regulator for asnA, asnC and gidA